MLVINKTTNKFPQTKQETVTLEVTSLLHKASLHKESKSRSPPISRLSAHSFLLSDESRCFTTFQWGYEGLFLNPLKSQNFVVFVNTTLHRARPELNKFKMDKMKKLTHKERTKDCLKKPSVEEGALCV